MDALPSPLVGLLDITYTTLLRPSIGGLEVLLSVAGVLERVGRSMKEVAKCDCYTSLPAAAI